MERKLIRGKVCPHEMGELFIYYDDTGRSCWYCSICDNDLYEASGKPETLGQVHSRK